MMVCFDDVVECCNDVVGDGVVGRDDVVGGDDVLGRADVLGLADVTGGDVVGADGIVEGDDGGDDVIGSGVFGDIQCGDVDGDVVSGGDDVEGYDDVAGERSSVMSRDGDTMEVDDVSDENAVTSDDVADCGDDVVIVDDVVGSGAGGGDDDVGGAGGGDDVNRGDDAPSVNDNISRTVDDGVWSCDGVGL